LDRLSWPNSGSSLLGLLPQPLRVTFRIVGLQTPKMTHAKLRLAAAAMGKPETKVGSLCKEIGITRQTLYRYVAPDGSLRESGKKLLKKA